MKKLLLFLSLCGIGSLYSAGVLADWHPNYDDPSLRIFLQDGTTQELTPEEGELFSTVKNISGDLDIKHIPLPVEISRNQLNDALNLYEPNSQYIIPPLDENPQEREKVIHLLKALNFLNAENYLEKVYIAWLNHTDNQHQVIHDNAPTDFILNQMGLPANLADDLSQLKLKLTPELIGQIIEPEHRPVSIQYLIERGQIPAVNNHELNLSAQMIGSLKGLQNIPNINTLTHLWVDNNHLSDITPGTFQGLNALSYLSLNNNHISNLTLGTFQGLNALNILNLNNNQLSDFAPGTFQHLNALTSLFIEHNLISALTPGTFQGLNALDMLVLDNNQLSALAPGTFQHLNLNTLTHLSLINNQLSALAPGTFQGLNALNTLNLAHNQLSPLAPGTFQGLNALNTLNLAHNQLSALAPGTFQGLNALNALFIEHNYLSPLQLNQLKIILPGVIIFH